MLLPLMLAILRFASFIWPHFRSSLTFAFLVLSTLLFAMLAQ